MKCKSCGREIDATKIKFCMYCGAVIEPEEPAKVICSHCGKEVKPGMKFCMHCGNAIEKQKKICVNCGYEFKENEKFCAKCGTSCEATKPSVEKQRTSTAATSQSANTQYSATSLNLSSLLTNKKFLYAVAAFAVICIISFSGKKNRSGHSSSGNTTEVRDERQEIINRYVGQWWTPITLQSGNIRGYGGEIDLTINADGSALVETFSADGLGSTRRGPTMEFYRCDASSAGFVFYSHTGSSVSFPIQNGELYTETGGHFRRKGSKF